MGSNLQGMVPVGGVTSGAPSLPGMIPVSNAGNGFSGASTGVGALGQGSSQMTTAGGMLTGESKHGAHQGGAHAFHASTSVLGKRCIGCTNMSLSPRAASQRDRHVGRDEPEAAGAVRAEAAALAAFLAALCKMQGARGGVPA